VTTDVTVIDGDAARWMATIERADSALAEAVAQADLPRLVAIHDQAAALTAFAQQQRYAEAWQREGATIKLRSERHIGEILAELERAKTGPRVMEVSGNVAANSDEFGPLDSAGDGAPESQAEPDAPPRSPYQQALRDNDIDPREARRWQVEASLSEPAFARFIAETPEPTSTALLREARTLTRIAPTPRERPATVRAEVNRSDVTNALAILDGLSEHDPEGVAEVCRVFALVAKKAGLAG
jgi:hypothetical protein